MNDIAERLRETACWDPERPNLPTGPLAAQLLEAADEIKRLRKRVAIAEAYRYGWAVPDDEDDE